MNLHFYFSLPVLVALFGCARTHHPAEPQALTILEKLKAKEDGWLTELKTNADKNTGWLSLKDCDGTLWTGEAVAAGHPGQLVLAEYAPGQVHRRPMASGDCWLPGDTPKLNHGSKSTVSKDMLTGYMLGAWTTKDVAALERLEAYGEKNNWVMGAPSTEVQDVVLSPEGQGLLARASEALGGDAKGYDNIPEACLPVGEDSEYHIQTLAIYMDGDVSGAISDLCFEALKANAKQFPEDALLAAALGVYTGFFDGPASMLLNDGYKCPSYVRPIPAYCTIHKAFAGHVILKRYGDK